MASMQEIICKCGCGRKKMVRTADIKRGWGKFYSKTCKARHQENRTHATRDYHKSYFGIDESRDEDMECVEAGWDGHKVWI